MTGSSIDADALAELAAIGCTEAEAAAWLGVAADALAGALADPALKRAWTDGALCGRVRIRRSQFALAERNATMAGLLGRLILGQGEEAGAAPHRLAEIVDTGIERDREN